MIGKCLCGTVSFQLTGDVPNLYQCHCSMCRKVTGSASNTATFVDPQQFKWLSGENYINSFVKDTGYRSDFFCTCGSPVPNKLRDTELYWVPAGLLEDSEGSEVVIHLHSGSKARWDRIDSCAQQYAEMPWLDEIHEVLQRTNG